MTRRNDLASRNRRAVIGTADAWSRARTVFTPEFLEHRRLLSAAASGATPARLASVPVPAAFRSSVVPSAGSFISKSSPLTARPADEIFPPPDDGGDDDGDIQENSAPEAGSSAVQQIQTAALPSTTGNWVSDGPSPITNGQIPGDGLVSGRVATIAPSLTDINTIYLGAAGGGVWKTINGGTSWSALTDGQADEAIGAIAIAPSNPSIIYAGTGEANNSGDSQYGDGVLKSVDGGATWSLLGTSYFNRNTFSKLVVDPANPNIVYATTSYGVDGVYGGWGIWKTTDGGVTWTDTVTSISNATDPCTDLVMDPINHLILYGAMGNYGGNTYNGIYKTVNGGTTWTLLPAFPGDASTNPDSGRIALAMTSNSAAGTPVLYASESSSATYGVLGVYRSPDGGTTWTNITPSSNYMGGQGWYDQFVAVSPNDLTQNTVFIGGSAGTGSIQESTNGGTSWSSIDTGASGNNGPHADEHTASFDASGRLLEGNDGGIWRLDNAGGTSILWTDLNSNLGITQLQGVAVGVGTAPVLLEGSQDNGTSLGSSTSTLLTEVEGGDGGFVAISPNNPNRVYHVAPVGSFGTAAFFRESTNGGTSWSSVPPSIGGDSSDFYPPFVIDPSYSTGGNDRLLLGTNHIYETTTDGSSWTQLTTTNANGWTTTSSVDTLATNGQTIYASASGHTYVTVNDGGTWTEHDVSSTAAVSELVVDPTNAMVAYAVLDRFTGAQNGKVYRTTNGGATWTDISGNLPDVPVRSIVVDPTSVTGGTSLYIGTDAEVYTSTNLGTSWLQLGSGLPAGVAVYDLRMNSSKILVAGTHGRGIWSFAVDSTSTVVTAAGPIVFGQPATFTATVSSPIGTSESGTVQFQVDGVNSGAPIPLTGNTVTFTTSSLTLANHLITAVYNGNGTYTGSTSAPLVVDPSVVVAASTTQQLAVSTPGHVLIAAGVTIAGSTGNWTGTLDVTDNNLDVTTGLLATASDQANQGYNKGSWNGTGIDSSSAAGNTTHLTAVGVIQNNQSGTPLFSASHLFDGATPGAGDILIKYTYYGDTNFDGRIDGSDYSRVDAAFVADRTSPGSVTGWFNGDFDYDGTVDGSDFALIDNAFNNQAQTTQFTTEVAGDAASIVIAIAQRGAAFPEAPNSARFDHAAVVKSAATFSDSSPAGLWSKNPIAVDRAVRSEWKPTVFSVKVIRHVDPVPATATATAGIFRRLPVVKPAPTPPDGVPTNGPLKQW